MERRVKIKGNRFNNLGEKGRRRVAKHGKSLFDYFLREYNKNHKKLKSGTFTFGRGETRNFSADICLEDNSIEIIMDVVCHTELYKDVWGNYTNKPAYTWNSHKYTKVGRKWELVEDWSEFEDSDDFKDAVGLLEYCKKSKIKHLVNEFMTHFNQDQRDRIIIKALTGGQK